MPRLLAGLAALAALQGAVARADDTAAPSNTVEDSSPAETYTGQILTVDGASVGALVAAGLIDSAGSDDTFADGLSVVAVGGLMLGGPMVHLAHHNPGRAFASLGLRLGLTIIGGAIGMGLAHCEDGEFLCGVGQAALGSSLGLVTAITLDAGVLARMRDTEDAPRVVPSPRRPRGDAFTLSPSLVATPNFAFAGVGGRF